MRRLGARGPRLPGDVRSAVPGRPLAWALAEDGRWLVGTRDGLTVVGGAAPSTIRWEEVHRADWDQESATLRVQEVQGFGQPVRVAAYTLEEPGGLLPLVRERVTASIVVQRRVPVRGKRGFTVVGRRAPSGDGPVAWGYEFDPGVEPDDPDVRPLAEAALRDVQSSAGW